MVVEPARDDDLPALLELYAQLNPEDPAPDAEGARAAWRRVLGAPGNTVLVAREGGATVATCTLTVIPNLTRGGRGYAVIENVVTDAAHRRRGLGRALLAEAVRRAAEAGCYKVGLATGSRREATLGFYEGAGFARAAKTHFERKL